MNIEIDTDLIITKVITKEIQAILDSENIKNIIIKKVNQLIKKAVEEVCYYEYSQRYNSLNDLIKDIIDKEMISIKTEMQQIARERVIDNVDKAFETTNLITLAKNHNH